MSQIRGAAEHLAEGVVYLRGGQSGGCNEEVGQSRPAQGGTASAKVLMI
ncbi:MAG: hypothetical protein AAB871_02195 [Patescibacteria group bacterium]